MGSLPLTCGTDSSDASGASLTASDAEELLSSWRDGAAKLGFSYFRAGGGLMQTGRVRILRVTPGLLTLETRGSRIAVVLSGARFEYKPAGFLRPDFQGMYDVPGLYVWLQNHDWLFLFPDQDGSNLRHLAMQLRQITGD